MKTYQLVARPDLRRAPHGFLELNESALTREIPDVMVRGLSETHFGERVVEVDLRRQSDAEALDTLSAALERLGFSLVEVTVSKWASAMAGKVVGAVGGFALGAGSTENMAVGLLTSIIGTFVGHLVGDAARQIVVDYKAHRDPLGNWVFGEMTSRQPRVSTELPPGTAFA